MLFGYKNFIYEATVSKGINLPKVTNQVEDSELEISVYDFKVWVDSYCTFLLHIKYWDNKIVLEAFVK